LGSYHQTVFEYETLLSEALSRFFVSRNPAVSHEKAFVELYGDRGPLNSLNKMADIAYYLAVIDERMRHDLGKFAKLRNKYAHNPKRGQLDKDAKMFKLVTDTYVFQESCEVLKNLTPQQVFLCIIDEIKARLRELPLSPLSALQGAAGLPGQG
jgi:DNA-binding MltR family transcriptional regulator